MSNYIKVVSVCTVSASGYGHRTFAANEQVDPSSPFYETLLWSGLATDTGEPAPPPVIPPQLKTLVYSGTPSSGVVPQYNATTQQFELATVSGGGGGGSATDTDNGDGTGTLVIGV